MVSRRERIEIFVVGGHPWGFSLKGGQESNKPLTISKLEKGGKAERAGIYVGDVLHSINNVVLSGSRNEAVQIVKMSGNNLTVEVERGSTPNKRRPYSGGYTSSRMPLTSESDFLYSERNSRPSSQIIETDQSETRTEFSRSSYSPSNLSVSSSSINERILSPQDGAYYETMSNVSDHLRNSASDVRDHVRSVDTRGSYHGDTSQPVVRLRAKKARDRGLPTERPRSWHASKHPGLDPSYISEETTMRSPGSGYLANPSPSPRYYQQPLAAPRRRSKGWFESGDLKSVYRPDVNGSKDSVISGDSHRSYRSGRLSVSSSRSSGTMSSSRGSLDNLLDTSLAPRSNLESHPQQVVLGSRQKQNSSSHLHSGIVSQQKNVFERLSHESVIDSNKGSREDLERIGRICHTPLDEVEKEKRARDPSSRRSPNHFSFSPPSVAKFSAKQPVRKKSRDQETWHTDPLEMPSNNNKTRTSPPASSGIKYSDAKIVKPTMLDPHRTEVPEPPQRDGSSAMAVKNHHIRSSSQVESNLRISTSPPCSYGRSPPHARVLHHYSSSSSIAEPTHRLTPIEKTIQVSGVRQERMFGVMAMGGGGNIVATSLTMSPKVGGESRVKTSPSDPNEKAPRYQQMKDGGAGEDESRTACDYVSRAAMKADEQTPTSEHSKSHSDDSSDGNAKGKYGSVWKTPQTQHSRARSANFSNVLRDWAGRETTTHENKSPVHEEEECELNLAIQKLNDQSPVKTTDHPSVLRSLQNAQSGDRRSRNFESKSSIDNYEKLWLADSNSQAKVNPESHSAATAQHKDWRSQYKGVELDDPVDDPFSPSYRYVDDIKGMSRKVLRETSFTRRDLDVSPSLQSVSQKKKLFQYPQAEQKKPSAFLHSRSRSFGNELDEEAAPRLGVKGREAQKGKPRPKSAGVFRPRTERQAPSARTSVPPHQRSKVNHRKSDSLPDDGKASLGYDERPSKSTTQNRRVSIDVKPQSYDVAAGRANGLKSDRRSEVIDFISRRTTKISENSVPGHYTSMINITSYKDEKAKPERLPASEDRSKKSRSPTGHTNGNRVQQLIENETPKSRHNKVEHGSVRKLKNFNETRQKFLQGFDQQPLSRAKSTSSLLDDESPKNRVLIQPASAMKSSDRSASLENMLDSRTDAPTTPPSNGVQDSDELRLPPREHRSKSSPNVTPLIPRGDPVAPLPRKHIKNHRQRHSNSSSASSATTISTLSSFSSGSSASIGIFPPVGEEADRSTSSRISPQKTSPLSVPVSADALSEQSDDSKAVSRMPIDTSTYRVTKRKSAFKQRRSVEVPPPSNVEPQKIENNPTENPTIHIESPTEELTRDPAIKDSSHSKALIAPPPSPPPLNNDAEKLYEKLVQKRMSCDLPPPPSVPDKSTTTSSDQQQDRSASVNPEMPSDPPNPLLRDETAQPTDEKAELDKRKCGGHQYQNVHAMNPSDQQYENVFISSKSSASDTFSRPEESASPSNDDVTPSDGDVTEEKHSPPTRTPPCISSEPLVPDVSFLPDPASAATLEEEHPDLTRDIIRGDKALEQVLTTSSKKAVDYMAGVFSQPSHDIVEEGIRYRRRKPAPAVEEAPSQTKPEYESLLPNDITSRDNLPASSTYYKTSASKARILNLMKEKIADGEIPDEEQETLDEINHKKVELVLSIKKKLDDLDSMRGLLDVEMRENECLGKQVHSLTKNMCKAKEQEKYNTLVQEVDKIINLLLSLSGRLARIENTIQMLPSDADKQEMEILCEKRKKLTEQHNDAKQLKESIDKRQKSVSEILAGYFDQEQFADYEHYIKMKSALIMEHRELDDKTKLGQEQMQCLRDSLPEEWQSNLDKLLEEE